MTRMSRLAFFLVFLSGYASAATDSTYVVTGPSPAIIQNMALQAGAEIQGKLKYHSGWVIRMSDASVQAFRAVLTRTASHIEVELDSPVSIADSSSSESHYPAKIPWGVAAVRAPEVHSKTRGQNAVVCIIDTGVQADHPDLRQNIAGGENTLVDETRASTRWVPWSDDHGHGTHVAGTVAAAGINGGVIGVAPEAKIFAVKALDANGYGGHASLAEGIRSCMAHGAQVINMSVAFGTQSRLVRKAVNDALQAGLILVAAAGNSRSEVSYPAKYPGVIAVSALNEKMRLASFSNFGPEILFAAPGVNILSTMIGGGYAVMGGTSQASPHVAGVAALLVSAKQGKLRGSELGISKEEEGSGIIDAVKSLEIDGRPARQHRQ